MHKILALDLGDVWIGVAISDSERILARPYTTVATAQLPEFLKDIFSKESIDTVVIGYPKTMRGTISKQTEKIIHAKDRLVQLFPHITWILWDERLSSKRAASYSTSFSREEKLKSHARAAAVILDTYLTFLQQPPSY